MLFYFKLDAVILVVSLWVHCYCCFFWWSEITSKLVCRKIFVRTILLEKAPITHTFSPFTKRIGLDEGIGLDNL